jgi:hypothetical protein
MPRAYEERWKNCPIEHLVLATDDFVVFLDPELDVDWSTSAEYDAKGLKDRKRHNMILNEAARIEATPCEGLSLAMKTHFKRLIGEAIARSLDNDYRSAETALASAAAYALARSQETSRFWYLSASYAMAAPFLAAGCILWVFRSGAREILGDGAFWLFLCGVAGALGALFSVITRAGKQTTDCSAGHRLHYLEGGSRIWAGVLSGSLVGLAVRSGVILGPLAGADRMVPIMLMAALAAGTGERLASSLISDLGAARMADHHEARPVKGREDDPGSRSK